MDEVEQIATRVVMEKADVEFVRVVEDLIELLCRKGVIRLEELPEAAQEKVRQRRALRQGQ